MPVNFHVYCPEKIDQFINISELFTLEFMAKTHQADLGVLSDFSVPFAVDENPTILMCFDHKWSKEIVLTSNTTMAKNKYAW